MEDVTWGPVSFFRGSSSWLRMTCWRIPATTLLSSSIRARASTKQPLEITSERGQDGDWLLCFFPLYLTISLSHSLSPFTNTHPCGLIKALNGKCIFSVLLCFLLVRHTPILSQTQFIGPTFRSSSQDDVRYSIASICLWLSYSFISNVIKRLITQECACLNRLSDHLQTIDVRVNT